MKKTSFILFAFFAFSGAIFAQTVVPTLQWRVETSRAQDHDIELYRGETVALQPRFEVRANAMQLPTNAVVRLLYRSDDMDADTYHEIEGELVDDEDGRVSVTWSPAADSGKSTYDYSLVVESVDDEALVRANGSIKLTGTVFGEVGTPLLITNATTVIDLLNVHATDTENPHGVTAGQVGAYTEAEADAAFQPLDADLTTLAGNDGSNLTGVYAVTLDGLGPRSTYNYSQAQREHLKARLAAVQANTSQHLTGISFGDSLNAKIFGHISEDYLKNWFDVEATEVLGVEWDEDLDNIDLPAGAIGGFFSISGAAITIKTDYDVEFTGTYYTLTSAIGDIQVAKNGGGSATSDRIIVPYVIEPGAGAFKIQVSTNGAAYGDGEHASWADPIADDIASGQALTGSELIIDADGAFGLGVVVLEYDAVASRIFQVVHESGGDIRLLRPAFFVETDDAVNWFAMGEGSNDFGNTTDASIPLMAGLIAAIKPDIITIQSDDSASSYRAFCPRLASAIEQANLGYEPTVIAVGEGPKSSGSYDIPASNNALAAIAGQYGWYFIDGLSIAKDWTTLNDLGWGGDGTHLSQYFYKELATRIGTDLGLNTFPVLQVPAYPTAADVGAAVRDVAAWKTAVAANSGTLTDDSEGAALQLMIELYRTGLINKVRYMLPLLGADLNAMQVPLIDTELVGIPSASNLTDSDVGESYGFQKAVGTDHRLNLNITASKRTGINDSWGIYFKDRTTGYPFGTRYSLGIVPDWLGWHFEGIHVDSDGNSQKFTDAERYYDGLHILIHNGGTMNWLLNGDLINSLSADTTPKLSTYSIPLGASRYVDNTYIETDAKIGFFFWAEALTTEEAALLDSVIQSVIVDVMGR